MPPPSLPAAAANNNALASSLLASLAPAAPPRASLFVAPPSVANALALLAAGATPGSQSAAQLGGVLGEGGVAGVAAVADAALSSPADGGGPTVACANSVWAPPPVTFSEPYLAAVARLGAVARPLTSGGEVNAWVRAATRGRVPSIVPDDVAARAVAVLVNALYFKGAWETAFDKRASGPLPFWGGGSGGGDTPTTTAHGMRRTAKGVPFARTQEGVTAVCLPYAGGTHEAVVALPADAATPVAATLAAVAALDADAGWHTPPAGVAITLPKFTAEWGGDVKQCLAAAGVAAPFASGADFAPMLAPGSPPPPPVSDVLHKVVVDVDEAGTEAAAATAVVMTRALLAFPEEFTVDRPFLFGVRHAPTRAWLFVGHVATVAAWEGGGAGADAGAGAGAPPPQTLPAWQPRGGLAPPGATASHPGTEGR